MRVTLSFSPGFAAFFAACGVCPAATLSDYLDALQQVETGGQPNGGRDSVGDGGKPVPPGMKKACGMECSFVLRCTHRKEPATVRVCEMCGKEFKGYRRTCSKECANEMKHRTVLRHNRTMKDER